MHIIKKKRNAAVTGFLAVLMSALIAFMGMPTMATSAYAANPDVKGSITVTGAKDGEEFIATRIIDTLASSNGALQHQFAEGFSYGDNSDIRTDRGLTAYSALSDDIALQEAATGFAEQITASSEQYKAIAAGESVTFEALPLGTYLIQCPNPNGAHSYQNMVGSVIPAYDGSEFVFEGPTMIEAKVIKGNETTGRIDKDVEPKQLPADPEDRILRYHVTVTPDGDNDLQNLHVVDELADESVELGLFLNQDVEVTSGTTGEIIENAVISYQTVNGRTVGYTIDIPTFPKSDVLNIDYTGDAREVQSPEALKNSVYAVADNFKQHSEAEAVTEPPSEYIEEDGNPLIAPIKEAIDGIISQTGDAAPWIFGGIGAAALALIIVVIVRRRNRDDE